MQHQELSKFGDEEAEHVTALTQAIRGAGGKPVKKPRFSFPVSDQRGSLKLAYALENTGVGAYNGAFDKPLTQKQVLAKAGPLVK
jgi:Ferritin-like domain